MGIKELSLELAAVSLIADEAKKAKDRGGGREKWAESAVRSIQMFSEAGIKINYHNLDV